MKSKYAALAGITLLLLAISAGTGAAETSAGDTNLNETQDVLSDDIEPYTGPIGPEHALYGLKLAFENMDESFTFNSTEKLGKQVAHARLRISEARAELRKENTKAAGKALDRYRDKIEEADGLVSGFSGEDRGIFHAQKMIKKHQYVLEQLLASHPNNTGLAEAYANSLELEEKFEQKTERKLERMHTKEGREILRETRKERTEVKAEIHGNVTKVKIEVRFMSNSTEKTAIANETLSRFRLSRETINTSLKIEDETEVSGSPTSTFTAAPAREKELEVKTKVFGNVSEIKAEFKFTLNVTERSEIVEGVYLVLAALTVDDIQNGLEIKVRKERKEIKEERREERKEEKRETKEERKEARQRE